MTQEEIESVLRKLKAGMKVQVSYDSPRGIRRYAVKATAVKKDDAGNLARISFERGTAVYVMIQKARVGKEKVWCFYQPNQYPLIDVEMV